MITFVSKGDFSNTKKYLEKIKHIGKNSIFDKYGQQGVAALASATPVDTGATSNAWYYEIENQNGGVSIVFKNGNVNRGINIAIILQYGHGTGTGGWVEGRDYINPAIQPIFDNMVNDLWKEVTSS